jgi:spore coat polysaccharide biosynthesis protein SpsF (cytidylyltransferase family)
VHQKKNTVVIVQARTDSRRFPGKVLANIEGKPLLWHVIDRIKKINNTKIVVATTKRKIDDEIIKIARKSKVEYFRGKKNDVLDRFYKAAVKFNADIIVRITADCPLIDPVESKKVLKKFLEGNFDYVSSDDRTYPKGLDTECFSFDALEKAWKEARLNSEREHVTPYIWKNQQIFKKGIVKSRKNLSSQRWVVDYKDDLMFVRQIYSRLYKKNPNFHMDDVITILQKEPNLTKINSDHDPNEGYQISLKND